MNGEELMTDVMTSIPTQVSVQRGATAERVPFGPTDSIRFMADGGPGLPEFYEERAGRGDGPPLHSHPWPSWELVLEGRIRFVVDGDTHVLVAGDSIYIPPEVPHAYVVESDTAHAVGIGLSGGRFPSLQRKAAPLMATEGGPPMDEVMALAGEHDTAILGPPLSVDPASA
jgi:mannose-6-phosphate isomerase-like protein (cupin superfamily)